MSNERDYVAYCVWDSSRKRPKQRRNTNTALAERPLRRLRPSAGAYLPRTVIRGRWRPSGTVDGCGVFAVVWTARSMTCWAALADFSPADQLSLIDECAWIDRLAGGHHHDAGDY